MTSILAALCAGASVAMALGLVLAVLTGDLISALVDVIGLAAWLSLTDRCAGGRLHRWAMKRMHAAAPTCTLWWEIRDTDGTLAGYVFKPACFPLFPGNPMDWVRVEERS